MKVSCLRTSGAKPVSNVEANVKGQKFRWRVVLGAWLLHALSVAMIGGSMYVVPQFTQLFHDWDMELPTMTIWIVGLSSVFVPHWYVVWLLFVPVCVFTLKTVRDPSHKRSTVFFIWQFLLLAGATVTLLSTLSAVMLPFLSILHRLS